MKMFSNSIVHIGTVIDMEIKFDDLFKKKKLYEITFIHTCHEARYHGCNVNEVETKLFYEDIKHKENDSCQGSQKTEHSKCPSCLEPT